VLCKILKSNANNIQPCDELTGSLEYLGQRSFRSKVIVRSHRHTHTAGRSRDPGH